VADVDYTRLIAAINKLEKTISSRSNPGTASTVDPRSIEDAQAEVQKYTKALEEAEERRD
jgi:hypothetical protein